MNRFDSAKEQYARFGVDVERALALAADKPISIHCWQGDDVTGFDNPDGGAGNGIQTTGNYPGRARTFEQLKADFAQAIALIPGRKRINLHACYAVFPQGQWVDRDRITYEQFAPWVAYAKEQGVGIDFNPTCFSHSMVKDGLTLSSPDEAVRRFWIDHCIACRRIAQRIGEELGDQVLNNVWIPDGFKDVPADRMGPRLRLKAALDEIFAEPCPNVIDCVESKVFAIGVESYTVGSNEFYTADVYKRQLEHLEGAGHNLGDAPRIDVPIQVVLHIVHRLVHPAGPIHPSASSDTMLSLLAGSRPCFAVRLRAGEAVRHEPVGVLDGARAVHHHGGIAPAPGLGEHLLGKERVARHPVVKGPLRIAARADDPPHPGALGVGLPLKARRGRQKTRMARIHPQAAHQLGQ